MSNKKHELQTLRFRADEKEIERYLESEFPEEDIYYSASWDEIRELAHREAQRQNLAEPGADVQRANYALSLLGIPHQDTEAQQDAQGNWYIYWR